MDKLAEIKAQVLERLRILDLAQMENPGKGGQYAEGCMEALEQILDEIVKIENREKRVLYLEEFL